jgi:hypothetical protein
LISLHNVLWHLVYMLDHRWVQVSQHLCKHHIIDRFKRIKRVRIRHEESHNTELKHEVISIKYDGIPAAR